MQDKVDRIYDALMGRDDNPAIPVSSVKLAAAMILVDTSADSLEEQLTEGLIRQHGFMTQYDVEIDIKKKSNTSGFLLGAFLVRPRQEVVFGNTAPSAYGMPGAAEAPIDYDSMPLIRIPILGRDNQVFPFDVFYDKTNIPQPLTKIRVQAALQVPEAEISAPASYAPKPGEAVPAIYGPRLRSAMRSDAAMWGKTASAEQELVGELDGIKSYTEEVAALLKQASTAKAAQRAEFFATPYVLLLHTKTAGFELEDAAGRRQPVSAELTARIPTSMKIAAVEDGLAIIKSAQQDDQGGRGYGKKFQRDIISVLIPENKVEKEEDQSTQVAKEIKPYTGGKEVRAALEGWGLHGGAIPAVHFKHAFSLVPTTEERMPFTDGFVALFDAAVNHPITKRASAELIGAEQEPWGVTDKTLNIMSLKEGYYNDDCRTGHLVYKTASGEYALSEPCVLQSLATKSGQVEMVGLVPLGSQEVVTAHVEKIADASPTGYIRPTKAEGLQYETVISGDMQWMPAAYNTNDELAVKTASSVPVDAIQCEVYFDDGYHFKTAQAEAHGLSKGAAKRLMAYLGQGEATAQAKLAEAKQKGTSLFYTYEDIACSPSSNPPVAIRVKSAAQHLGENAPNATEVANMVWGLTVHENLEGGHHGVFKVAAKTGKRSLDSVLGLQFVNDNSIDKYLSMIPELEICLRKLADLTVAARLGVQIDQARASSAMKALDRVLVDLKRIQVAQAMASV